MTKTIAHPKAAPAQTDKNDRFYQEFIRLSQLLRREGIPYRLESDGKGKFIMTAMYYVHGKFQVRIAIELQSQLPNGSVTVETLIRTSEGEKACDVAWTSLEREKLIQDEFAVSIAPEICIEVKSKGNTKKDLLKKKDLFLASGAKEVWICHSDGHMEFYNEAGLIGHSELVPNFPQKLDFESNLAGDINRNQPKPKN